MNTYLKLSLVALMPVVLSAVLYLIDKKTAFQKIKPAVKQVIYGVLFGMLAVFGTEYGIDLQNATLNVRDAAPVCAGLIFGAPAGIIAGFIGGIERFFAVYWGAGMFTRVACTIATIVAGLFAAMLRKWMFDDKKPAWYYGLATGFVAEVLHMLMVFLTNLKDAREAYSVVMSCANPMILLNGLSVMFAVLLVSILSGERRHIAASDKKISQTFQWWLLICVVIAFTLTSGFTFVLESGVSTGQTDSLLSLNLMDVKQAIGSASDENLLVIAQDIAREVGQKNDWNTDSLRELEARYNVSEINIVAKDGKIVASTDEVFLGFDMASGDQSKTFMALTDGKTEAYVQEYGPMSYDNTVYRKYAGVALRDGGFVQVGYDAERFQKDISQRIKTEVLNRHVGENGYLIVCDRNYNILRTEKDSRWEQPNATDIILGVPRTEIREGVRFPATLYGVECYCMAASTEGYSIISVLPQEEALFVRNMTVYITVFMEVIVFAILFVVIYFLIKRLIVNNIHLMNKSLSKITQGDLNVVVNVRSNKEFASLSDDINSTVCTLKHYIAEAESRIDKELEFARAIQSSALPRVFPPFPNHKEFDIFASMDTAKEVGGDFYDFYFVNENQVAFLIADVSGKGIPAAMFMMTAKTMLKNHAETGMAVHEVFRMVNNELCENNDAGMFVTAWMGFLNIYTGEITFANAGHNPPLIRRKDGTVEWLKSRPGLVLAGMDGVPYRANSAKLEPGDKIYLYTDGITEATDASNQLFGEERLLECLQKTTDDDTVETVCRKVKEAVDGFVGEAPQFDDMTMLCLTFAGAEEDETK